MYNLEEISSSLVKTIDYAGILAQRLSSNLEIEEKLDGSLVTNADKKVETWLREQLLKLLPETGFWGEEEGFSEESSNGLWLIDPIDGTTNYAYGGPLWGISIALYQKGRIKLGAIALPDLGEIYLGIDGMGATLNGNPLLPIPASSFKSNDPISYNDALMLTYPNQKWPGKMRCLGAFVIDGTFFATQRIKGLISYKIALYDIAACVCIIRELNGDIFYGNGKPFDESTVLNGKRIGEPLIMMPKNSGFTMQYP